MELPTEFLTLESTLTLVGMGLVLFFIVQATKELGVLAKVPTLLYAWVLGSVLLFIGTVIRSWPDVRWAEAAYLSLTNGVLAAAVAVLTHQAGSRIGLIKE